MAQLDVAGTGVDQLTWDYERAGFIDPLNGSSQFVLVPTSEAIDPLPAFAAELYSNGWSSVYMQGEFEVDVSGFGFIDPDQSGAWPGTVPPYRAAPDETVRPGMEGANHDGVAVRATNSWVNFTGDSTWVEYHGFASTCGEGCPSNAARETTSAGPFEAEALRYVALDGKLATSFESQGATVVLGQRTTNIDVKGLARLPLATATVCDTACTEQSDGTILVKGNFTIQELRTEQGQMLASVLVHEGRVQFDETTVAWTPIAGVAAGAGVAAVVLWLVSRQLLGQPLAHEGRAEIHRTIQAHEGIAFRQLQRVLGSGNGKLHYHLSVLEAAGCVGSVVMGRRKVFFSNETTPTEALFAFIKRDKGISLLLHDLDEAGPMARGDFVASQSRRGEPRSTTASRVKRLVKLGFIHEKKGIISRAQEPDAKPGEAVDARAPSRPGGAKFEENFSGYG